MADSRTQSRESSRLRAGAVLMALAGLAFVGYATVFLVLNFAGAFLELGIGPDEVDKGRADVEAFSPQLAHYISHLHIALSGFIAATGLAIAGLSWYGVQHGSRWAFVTAVVVAVMGLGVSVPAHYPWGTSGRSTPPSSFSWPVLGRLPAACGTPTTRTSGIGDEGPRSNHRRL